MFLSLVLEPSNLASPFGRECIVIIALDQIEEVTSSYRKIDIIFPVWSSSYVTLSTNRKA